MELLEVKAPDWKSKYVMHIFLNIIGYPYKFVEEWENSAVKICVDPKKESNVDIIIPPPNGSIREITYFDDIPILHGSGKPRYLFNGKRIGFDLIGTSFNLLTREEEVKAKNFTPYKSILYELEVLHKPVINYYIRFLKELIEQKLWEKDINLPEVPLWKGNKQFAVGLTHDVDLISSKSLSSAIKNMALFLKGENLSRRPRFEALLLSLEQLIKLLRERGSDPAWNFDEWIELEKKYNVHSTFYFASNHNDMTLRDPHYTFDESLLFHGQKIKVSQMIRKMEKNGWEVGLHGSIQSYNNPELFKKEKNILEKQLRGKITGCRQHYLNFDPSKTWEIYNKVGLKYSSNIGYNEKIGHRAGIAFPYIPSSSYKNFDRFVLEFPITIHDVALFYYESLNIKESFNRCIRVINEVKKTNGLATLSWHPYTIHDTKLSGRFEVYKMLLQFLSTQDVFIGSLREIYEWWMERSKLLNKMVNKKE